MFGHQDDSQTQQTDNHTPADNGTLDDSVTAPTTQLLDEHADDGLGMDSPDPLADTPPAAPAVANDDLLNLKQQALQQLSPLVGHLEQTPEEKFRTTMMMIQAADNQDLLKVAYEAAQAIGDEKARAQALLDVINEINYFTQHKS